METNIEVTLTSAAERIEVLKVCTQVWQKLSAANSPQSIAVKRRQLPHPTLKSDARVEALVYRIAFVVRGIYEQESVILNVAICKDIYVSFLDRDLVSHPKAIKWQRSNRGEIESNWAAQTDEIVQRIARWLHLRALRHEELAKIIEQNSFNLNPRVNRRRFE